LNFNGGTSFRRRKRLGLGKESHPPRFLSLPRRNDPPLFLKWRDRHYRYDLRGIVDIPLRENSAMWLSHLLLAVTLAAQMGTAPTGTIPPASPAPIVTQQRFFAIPFHVNPVDDPTRQLVEVQLLVSDDRGAHWDLYTKAPPTQQQFLFRAAADGEYWFALRTVDSTGHQWPETISSPGMRVQIEARSPDLKPVVQPGPTAPVVAKADLPARPPTRVRMPQTELASARTDAPAAAEPRGSVAIAINPAVGSKYPDSDDRHGASVVIPGLPPGERPRMVNSRLFELEYDIDAVGPSGVARVELWGTRDGGKTWRSFAVNNNKRSPLLVSVDEEGIYGFRVVVTNGSGLGGTPPKSGDLPDLWIGVDLTKPTARIVSAQQGVDAEARHLVISYRADDKMLAARPISLSYAQSHAGPWITIASGLENTGRYAWPVDARTPSQFFLRLEVRDEAGNVGVHEMSEPITIDQSRPTIHVRDVHPVG
jgi:hypothetical protein